MKTFEKVEHTADIGIKAYGQDLKELFTNAALGMMSILIGDGPVSKVPGSAINVKGKDLHELFVNFLEELLYLLNVKHFVVSGVTIHQLEKSRLSAQVLGEPYSEETHEIAHDIKGVTFHQLRFEKEGDLLTVQVIFDI
jgi:SHS2 domain-containing protein